MSKKSPAKKDKTITPDKAQKRESGLSIIRKIPWGTHLCQFYKTRQDLLDILVPYFKTGLESNEFCMWITSYPLDAETARKEMQKKVPNFKAYLKKGQIEILPHTEWYLKDGRFNENRVLQGWIAKLNNALGKGYDGLRLTGNPFWLEKHDWKKFVDYEKTVNNIIGRYKILAICTYSLDKCAAPEIIDVVSNHEYALIKRDKDWTIIEGTAHGRNDQLTSRRQLERYKSYVEVGGGLGWITDANGLVTEDIPSWRNYTGQSYDETKGKGWSTALHPDDIGRTLNIWTRAVKNKTSYETEYRVRRHDGVFRNFLARGIPIKEKDGSIMEWIGTCIDITERKQIEDELQRRKSLLKKAEELSHTGAWEWDIQKDQWTFSDEWLKIHGCAKAALATKDLIPIAHPDDRARINSAFAAVRQGLKPYSIEHRIIRQDTGEIRIVKAYGEFVKNKEGMPLKVLGVAQDITERKAIEEAWEHEKHALQSVINNTHAQIAYLDRNFNFVMVNSAYEKGSGHPAKELIGKNHFNIFPSEENLKIFKNVRATGNAVEYKAKPFTYTDQPERGTTYWDWILAPIKNKNGEVINLVLSLTDVTERIALEERQRNFISILGHELRNPLAPIMLTLDLIDNKKLTNDPDTKEMLETIRHQTNNINKLLKDLLDIPRIERGKIDLAVQTLELNSLIKRVAKTTWPAIKTYNQKLKMLNSEKPIKIVADPLRIEQIITNLLNNASKYSGEHGTIWLDVKQKKDRALITVKDRGIGIVPGEQNKIFEIFNQQNNSFIKTKSGLGIGLYLARELARLHKGDISVYSKGLGMGSKFTVELPLKINGRTSKKQERALRKNLKTQSKILTQKRKKVLIADDNIVLANTIEKAVKNMGYATAVSHDGLTALKMAYSFKPDIALIDLRMPGIDGLELARKIKKDGKLSSMTLVALTGYGQDYHKQSAKEAGFNSYLIKPVGINDISMILSGKVYSKFQL